MKNNTGWVMLENLRLWGQLSKSSGAVHPVLFDMIVNLSAPTHTGFKEYLKQFPFDFFEVEGVPSSVREDENGALFDRRRELAREFYTMKLALYYPRVPHWVEVITTAVEGACVHLASIQEGIFT